MNQKIATMNVRGLNDSKKRRDVFSWLRKQDVSIFCLQDTHSVQGVERMWEAEWGYKVFFSSFRSDSRGSAILLKNNFEFKIHKTVADPEGNYIVIDISCFDTRITMASIYGPNKDNPAFYKKLKEIVEEFQNPSIIMCGDWNIVQSYELDNNGYLHQNNPEARLKLIEIKRELDLIDPWREINTDLRRYTWRSGGRILKQARLDYFLITPDMYSFVEKVDINPGYRTDHSLVILNLGISESRRGRGFWKFNQSLLHDGAYYM